MILQKTSHKIFNIESSFNTYKSKDLNIFFLEKTVIRFVSCKVLDTIQLKRITNVTETSIEFEWIPPLRCFYDVIIYCQDNPDQLSKKAVLNSNDGMGYCDGLLSGKNYSIIAITILSKEEFIYQTYKILNSTYTGSYFKY